MRLVVDCPPLSEPVYVDRDMYEKIVLNLLSNAFKFTFAGEIAVSLREKGDAVELSVTDTGTGIAEEQIHHIFERFHRIVGLALVRELVKLHGGSVNVTSVVGKGSTFTVTLPKGTAHLPPDRIGAARRLSSTALTMEHFVEEAAGWLPAGREKQVLAAADIPGAVSPPRPTEGAPARIVWADDNADMRNYVRRLLAPLGDVEAVPDGEAALAAVHRGIPDLILADVMMPGLDGFGLLRALRADERTRSIPVVLLSARAGEESRVEGMEAGADDYLVKPFSARELVARVDAHLKMARLRTESQARQSLLLSELNHRVKNTLTIVQAIASQTLRLSTDPRQFVENFKARLQALSRAHNLLTRSDWKYADITEVVRDQILLDGETTRIKLRGPEALLTPQSAVALSLVLHELGTNARKYGALSAPWGHLDVHWSVGAPDRRLQIDWVEASGPPVRDPQKRGFGTTLIEKSLGGVGGTAELRFHPDGLHCAIQLPLPPGENGDVHHPEVA